MIQMYVHLFFIIILFARFICYPLAHHSPSSTMLVLWACWLWFVRMFQFVYKTFSGCSYVVFHRMWDDFQSNIYLLLIRLGIKLRDILSMMDHCFLSFAHTNIHAHVRTHIWRGEWERSEKWTEVKKIDVKWLILVWHWRDNDIMRYLHRQRIFVIHFVYTNYLPFPFCCFPRLNTLIHKNRIDIRTKMAIALYQFFTIFPVCVRYTIWMLNHISSLTHFWVSASNDSKPESVEDELNSTNFWENCKKGSISREFLRCAIFYRFSNFFHKTTNFFFITFPIFFLQNFQIFYFLFPNEIKRKKLEKHLRKTSKLT